MGLVAKWLVVLLPILALGCWGPGPSTAAFRPGSPMSNPPAQPGSSSESR